MKVMYIDWNITKECTRTEHYGTFISYFAFISDIIILENVIQIGNNERTNLFIDCVSVHNVHI